MLSRVYRVTGETDSTEEFWSQCKETQSQCKEVLGITGEIVNDACCQAASVWLPCSTISTLHASPLRWCPLFFCHRTRGNRKPVATHRGKDLPLDFGPVWHLQTLTIKSSYIWTKFMHNITKPRGEQTVGETCKLPKQRPTHENLKHGNKWFSNKLDHFLPQIKIINILYKGAWVSYLR